MGGEGVIMDHAERIMVKRGLERIMMWEWIWVRRGLERIML